jgi:septal ring factor EnvC (AmiA/AmiB activator)
MNTTQHQGPRAKSRIGVSAAAMLAGVMFGATGLLAGCASTPAPDAQIQAANQAIADAERAQASQHAADILSEAKSKLAAAQSAVDQRDMDDAARLADEARVDAELASARTTADKATQANDEIRRGTEALQQELQRSTTTTTTTTTTTGGTP